MNKRHSLAPLTWTRRRQNRNHWKSNYAYLMLTAPLQKVLLPYPTLLTNYVAPEPAGSSPYSQETATALPWANGTHSTPLSHSSLRSIPIPSFHLCLSLPCGLFPSGFPTKTLRTFLSHACNVSRASHSPLFACIIILGMRAKSEAPHRAASSIILLFHPS
jgi:hypothetical protein